VVYIGGFRVDEQGFRNFQESHAAPAKKAHRACKGRARCVPTVMGVQAMNAVAAQMEENSCQQRTEALQ